MLGMKIVPDSWPLLEKLALVLEEDLPESGPAGLNDTFVVVEYDMGRQKLAYYSDEDFRKNYRFEEGPYFDRVSKVIPIPNTEDD